MNMVHSVHYTQIEADTKERAIKAISIWPLSLSSLILSLKQYKWN